MNRNEAESFAREVFAEYRRTHPLGCIVVREMTDSDLLDTRAWLLEEQNATGHSFYCNWKVIVDSRQEGYAFVACVNDRCVGLLVTDYGDGPSIIATRPGFRRLGIGHAMLAYSVKLARQHGKKTIEARCVTYAGEQLCRAFGFLPEETEQWTEQWTLQINGEGGL